MANLVYERVSTDQQPTARQSLVLDESGIENPVVFEEDPGTSSHLHPLQRPKFRELLTYARPGDTVHISEMFRLVRGTGHILDVLDVRHRDQVALRIHDDAFSAMDLTARHPRTGELLSTVKFMVQPLAAVGELQRDLTYDGLRAAEAKGSKGGQRPAVATEKTEAVRTAYLEGRSIAALARDHGVSRGAIRTAVAEARATPCASAPSWRYTTSSSSTAGPSTALPAPRRPRHSARPIKIIPWRLLAHLGWTPTGAAPLNLKAAPDALDKTELRPAQRAIVEAATGEEG
ncbi:recombinase family protein [Streptomyces rimosus]|uniref:recombinase family protein n=1 Tax=Streptomyces rimosus TaxID=1927 RepID=UPI000B000448|nr:recombinase family protein [Streptomyces rimosus]